MADQGNQVSTNLSSSAQPNVDAERRYLALFNAIDQGFCTIDVAFDADDRPTDYRFVEVSPSFTRHTGIDAHFTKPADPRELASLLSELPVKSRREDATQRHGRAAAPLNNRG